MKLFINYFNDILTKPSYNFSLNIFLFKKNLFFNLKNLTYIHIFTVIKNKFNIKIFNVNYILYTHFLFYFICINIIIQIFFIIINW